MNNADNKPQKRDLKPLEWTDEQLDALAGIDGFTPEMLAAAQAWGSPMTRSLLAAQEDDDERN
jgi:hypothetical protein